MSGLDKFFEPASIMVIGASRTPGKAGNTILQNMLANGYQGAIYPVNPAVEEVLGLRCFPSIAAVPAIPDLAIAAVPATTIVETMAACAEKGVRAAVITTSGFAEVDDGGERQTALRQLSQSTGLRMMGPNTSGITSTPGGFSGSMFPLGKIPRGPVSVIAQTGNFATFTMKWLLTGENVGVCRVAGLGNMVDVTEADVLEYYASDPETRAIAVYLEGFGDPRRFLQVAKSLCRSKPIIALKSGRTAAGVKAVASHTASLASDDAIVDSLLRQAGVVRVQTYVELVDCLKLLSFQPVPRGNRLAVLTPSGALGIVAADAGERLGLRLGELSGRSLAELGTIFPDYVRVGNPIDIWGAALVHGVFTAYERGVRVALADEGIDAVLCILTLIPSAAEGTAALDPEKLAFLPRLAREHPDKPIVVALTGDKAYFDVGKRYLEEHSIPVFPPVEPGLEALAHLNLCGQHLRTSLLPARVEARAGSPGGAAVELNTGGAAMDGGRDAERSTRAAAMLEAALAAGRTGLSETDARRLLELYGIPLPPYRAVATAEEAVSAAEEIGLPVAVKGVVPGLLHKTEAGAVAIGLASVGEVRAACRAMADRLAGRLEGFLVERMAPAGLDLLVGVVRDRTFGPVVSLGYGGTLVELLKTVEFRLVPLDEEEARSLVADERLGLTGQGLRNLRVTRPRELEDVLMAVAGPHGLFAEGGERLSQFEINPLRVTPAGLVALDVKTVLGA